MFSEGWRAEKNEEEKRSDGRFQHLRIVRALSQDTTHLGSRGAKKVRPLWGGGGEGRDAAATFFETHPVGGGAMTSLPESLQFPILMPCSPIPQSWDRLHPASPHHGLHVPLLCGLLHPGNR